MPNLDLNILNIMGGDTPVLKVMQGDDEVYPNLPYDAEVEYLQSDGTAYIDTGIKAKSTIQFEIAINLASATKTFVLGGRTALNSKQIGVLIDTSTYSWRYVNTTATSNHTIVAGNYYISNRCAKNALVVNDILTKVTDGTFSSDYNLFIWGQNNGGAAVSGDIPTEMRFKYAQFYDERVLVRDYIPVRVGQVGYLYDKVTKQLFGNANSSGAFTFGNDV